MMTKLFNFLVLIGALVIFASCNDDDDDDFRVSDLVLNINGLENLGSDYVYEGWIIVNGKAITTGVFTVNDQGVLSKTSFTIQEDKLDAASTFVLTIEPAVGDDPSPSSVHILGGDFQSDMSQLTIDHSAAFGMDFSNVAGKYILATPTDGTMDDENSGIWFLDLSQGSPNVGLTLEDLPEGWRYEGWTVINGMPVTSGKFDVVDDKDDFDGFSSQVASGPPFPGEDYLFNAPAGLDFPTNLAGGTAVISIEPVPDNSPSPFLLKPLVGAIPSDAVDHMTYTMNQNLNFPQGTASR